MALQFEESGQLRAMTEEELLAADDDSSFLVCSRGMSDSGRQYWCYIAIKPSKYKQFVRAMAENTPIRFKEYGEILKYGFDEEVPVAIKKEMQKHYGCDDHYMEHLMKDIQKQRVDFLKQQEDKRISAIVTMLKNQPPV